MGYLTNSITRFEPQFKSDPIYWSHWNEWFWLFIGSPQLSSAPMTAKRDYFSFEKMLLNQHRSNCWTCHPTCPSVNIFAAQKQRLCSTYTFTGGPNQLMWTIVVTVKILFHFRISGNTGLELMTLLPFMNCKRISKKGSSKETNREYFLFRREHKIWF